MLLQLDYFYGGEAEQYSFSRVPKALESIGLMRGESGAGASPRGSTSKTSSCPRSRDGPADVYVYSGSQFYAWSAKAREMKAERGKGTIGLEKFKDWLGQP